RGSGARKFVPAVEESGDAFVRVGRWIVGQRAGSKDNAEGAENAEERGECGMGRSDAAPVQKREHFAVRLDSARRFVDLRATVFFLLWEEIFDDFAISW